MRFPGGEVSLVIPEALAEKPAYATVTGADPVDYLALGLWADYVHQLGHRAVALLPYLPAARADRGVPFGAKVYAELINGFALDQVIVFDPHSEVAPALINNAKVIGSAPYIRRAAIGRVSDDHDFVGVIAPDAGAVRRAQAAATALHLPLYLAEKHRDFATGRLSGFSCEPLPAGGRLLVVDDICDGGGTFKGLAQDTGLPRERLALFVSHGVFSGNAPALRQHFGEIISSSTDSRVRSPACTPTTRTADPASRTSAPSSTLGCRHFGLQAFLDTYADSFRVFFDADEDQVCAAYEARLTGILGPNTIGSAHIRALHRLGFLPLRFCAVPEGTAVPVRIPSFTIENTHPDFFWLTNYIETVLSAQIWQASTTATLARAMRETLEVAAATTGTPAAAVDWQGARLLLPRDVLQ